MEGVVPAIAIDRQNRIYVADYLNHRIELYPPVNTTAQDSFLNPVAESKGGERATAGVGSGSTRKRQY